MTGLEHAGATGASHRRLRRGHRAADNPARMDKAEPIAVIGAGAWGTALAQALAADGRRVALWARREDVVAAIRGQRENTPCLPGVTLHAAIAPSTDLAATLAGATTALLAVPAAFAPAVAARIRDCGAGPQSLTIAAKGFAQPGSRLLGDAIAQTLPGADIAVLSGPSFAQDVARGLPTAIVLAARTPDIARALAARLATPRLRIYASDDPVGVQIGGALKNVVAIACGIVVGRGLGESARAALLTRGLAEMARLAAAMGGRRTTLMGLSGLGDLALTCGSAQSRNHSFGIALGRGQALAGLLAGRRSVVEGIGAATAAAELATRFGLDLPICEAVAAILQRGAAIDDSIAALMARPLKEEE
jgi:glycerol-3-phosphate dehydrogenase (NAD(P)+)